MFKRIISLALSLTFLLQQTVFAYTASLNLSGYLNQGPNLTVSDRFRPVNLRYFSYQPLTNDFKILLDKGDSKDITDTNLKGSASVLLDYFKIGLSLPNDKFWVNLRPDSQDQIIDEELAKTDLGKVMLEADLKLKQDTALFTSPKTPQGKEYWNKLYQRAGELFGTENITIPTLTRPWIVPGEIILRESADKDNQASGAYIYKANLKVMLEDDYLTSRGERPFAPTYKQYEFNDPRLKELNQYSTQLIRELILPKLTQKVNSSKDYANLRQVYFSLILARWFKETFNQPQAIGHKPQADNELTKLIDSHNLTNLSSKQAWDKTTYFNAYQKSFQEGEYNLSEPIYTPTGQVIRRYMSGGMVISPTLKTNGAGTYVGGPGDIVSSAITDRATRVFFTKKELNEGQFINSRKRVLAIFHPIDSNLSKLTEYAKNFNEALETNKSFLTKEETAYIDNLLRRIRENREQVDAIKNELREVPEGAVEPLTSLGAAWKTLNRTQIFLIDEAKNLLKITNSIQAMIDYEKVKYLDSREHNLSAIIKDLSGQALLIKEIDSEKDTLIQSLGNLKKTTVMVDAQCVLSYVDGSSAYTRNINISIHFNKNGDILLFTKDDTLGKQLIFKIKLAWDTKEIETNNYLWESKINNLSPEGAYNLVGAIKEALSRATSAASPLIEDEKFNNKFGQRLKDGDKAVLDEIVDFYKSISGGHAQKMEFYKWLQNHQSALAAKAQLKIGLDWTVVVPELVAIAKGESSYGNPYSAARQLYELESKGTLGGLTDVPRQVVREAEKAWDENYLGLTHFLDPVILPEFPIVKEDQKPGYLVIERHGQASFSEDVYNRWAGWLNSLITANGREEARNGGAKLYGVKFDEAYSSDLSRAVDTMDEFLIGIGQTDIRRKETKALREKNYGWLGGQSRKDIEELFGKEQFTQWRRAINGRVPLGESLADTKERTGKYVLEEILPAIAAGKNVVISAHGNSLRSLLVILREHTLGRILNDEEVIKLEVPNSVPIAIKFDKQLKHEEMWSNQHSPEEILEFLQVGSPLTVKEFSQKLDKMLAQSVLPPGEFSRLMEMAAQLPAREEISEKIQDKIYDTINRISKEAAGYIVKEKSPVLQAHTIGYVLTIIESGLGNYIVSEEIKLKLIQAIKEALIRHPKYSQDKDKEKVKAVITMLKIGHIEAGKFKGFIEDIIKNQYPAMQNVIDFNKGEIAQLFAQLLERDERAGMFIASVRDAKKIIAEQNDPTYINEFVRQSLFDAIAQDMRIEKGRIEELEKILDEQVRQGKQYFISDFIKDFLDKLKEAKKGEKKRKLDSILDNSKEKLMWVYSVSLGNQKERNQLRDFLAQGLRSYYLKAAQEVAENKQEARETVNTAKKVIQSINNSTIERYFDTELSTVASAWNKMKGSSSALTALERTLPEAVGGIDFRQMNMLIQPQGSFASSSLDFSLPALSKAEIESFDLDTELAAIQKMASSGIAPSDERLKEYLAVCFAKERTGQEIDSLKLCLLDVFEQQQLEAKETPNGYKEVLVIADTRGYVLKEGRLAASKHDIVSLN